MNIRVVSQDSPRLLDRMRVEILLRHYSLRTEQAYTDWVRRRLYFHDKYFHDKRHTKAPAAEAVRDFLPHQARERNVPVSMQNQARSVLMSLYRKILKVEPPWLNEVIAARAFRRLPVVLLHAATTSARYRNGSATRT